MQTILIGLLVLTAMCLSPDSTLAEGALAIGLPNNVVKDGFSMGDSFNQKTSKSAIDRALRACRQKGSRKSQELCKIVDTFHDQCVVAAADPQSGTPGVGWAIARDKRMAESAALAKCEATAGAARRAACRVQVF